MQRYLAPPLSELQIGSHFQRSPAKHPSALLMAKPLTRQLCSLRVLETFGPRRSTTLPSDKRGLLRHSDPRIFASVTDFHDTLFSLPTATSLPEDYPWPGVHFVHLSGRTEMPPTHPQGSSQPRSSEDRLINTPAPQFLEWISLWYATQLPTISPAGN